KSNNVEL
ncbi:hypothetical protein D030_0818B, partial [Vibrio parahaemolyticus AQ3810]